MPSDSGIHWGTWNIFCVQKGGLLYMQIYMDAFFPFYFLNFIYLFMRDTERGRDPGRGRSRLHAGSPTWGSIPGLQDHALG